MPVRSSSPGSSLAPGPIGARVAHVRATLEDLQQRLSSEPLLPTAFQLHGRSGYNPKLLLESRREGGTPRQLYLHKPMSRVDAGRTQFVTVLANLMGIATPLAVAHEYRLDPALTVGSVGTTQIFLEGYETPDSLEVTDLESEPILYLLLTRWFNEVVGNLHGWWGQLLIQRDPTGRIGDVVMIDFDDAFACVDPEFLRTALTVHFGKRDIRLEDCRWLTRPFDFRAPLAWDPDTLDSPFTVYGPLFQAYLAGRLEIDTRELTRRVMLTAAVPASAVEQAMEPFFATSLQHLRNSWVFLPAAPNPKVSIEHFRVEFLGRLERSRAEFCRFIQSLESARGAQHHPITAYYARAPRRTY